MGLWPMAVQVCQGNDEALVCVRFSKLDWPLAVLLRPVDPSSIIEVIEDMTWTWQMQSNSV